MKKLILRSAITIAISSLFATTAAFSAEQPKAEDLVGRAYAGLHLLHIETDSQRFLTSNPLSSLNNGDGFGGELGYRLNTTTEFRLSYSDINLDAKNGGFDKPNSSKISFNALYFPTEQNFYLLAGVSELDIVDSKLSSNLGLGYRHYLSKKTALYFETKAHYQFDDYYDDYSAQIGFTYFFGESSNKPSSKKSNVSQTDLSASDKVTANALTNSANDYSHSHNEAGTHLHGDTDTHTHSQVDKIENGIAAHTHEVADAHTHNTDATNTTHTHSAADKLALSMDSDNDGISDFDDKCIDTSGMYQVDSSGCTMFMDDVVSINLLINFDNNKAVINPEYFAQVKEVADFLNTYKNANVIIEGHASALGNDLGNKNLSQLRADAVVEMLETKYEINENRLSAVGYGEERLLNKANTKAAHAENRRTVATVSVDKKTPLKR